MIRFEHNDSAYLTWLHDHPQGYVLNVRDHPDPQYVVLHRATCKTISRSLTNPAGYTGGGYRKIVSATKDALRPAARQQGRRDGTFSKSCGHCTP